MWKSVTRRIRDTFERSANHFDRRSTTVVNCAPGNFSDEKKNKPCCHWFASRKCWKSFENGNRTNSKKWRFEHLNKNWIDAITWSGALVLGWYTSQLIHLKLKNHLKVKQRNYLTVNDLFSSVQAYLSNGNKSKFYLNNTPRISEVVSNFAPTVYLVSNDRNEKSIKSTHSGNSTGHDNSDDDLGEVLNSIENKLGIAAIENGQYHEGLGLLRSAANRNHAPALYNLGLCYENGRGVSADDKIAMGLYKAAAALKHPGALYNLGVFYGQGRGGLKRDQETATRLLKLAAVQGQQDAIDALKALDVTITEAPNNDLKTWSYQDSSYSQNDNIVPMHTRLFVDNFNYFQALKIEATF